MLQKCLTPVLHFSPRPLRERIKVRGYFLRLIPPIPTFPTTTGGKESFNVAKVPDPSVAQGGFYHKVFKIIYSVLRRAVY